MSDTPIKADWVALDWGTSNLRAWAMGADGSIRAEARSDAGMSGIAPGPEGFEPVLLGLAGDWLAEGRKTDVIACGMVGARQGWAEAGYRAVPAQPLDPGAITRAVAHDARLNVHILGGLSQTNPHDVMRGEETQIAGFLSRSPGFEGVVCLPGTHTKWAQIVGGEVFHFASFMTGELFALLAGKSILRHSLDLAHFERDAFVEAAEESLARPERIAAKLFTLRAEHLLQGADPAAASRLSGYLLGMEVAGAKPYWLGQPIALVAAGRHAERYGAIFDHLSVDYTTHDPDTCVLQGLSDARTHLLTPEGTA
ncbi:2-dehydro-3-deoxygalactonokinase [Oceanibium sediminis]|uniref:2-dehydro-3-deoxygalactonokinase n=1 Tax=Oceanibium sediminis TaxID=2026339 RepID=UPI000DD3A932|nr:2-dehydro-3-deoxygalactonokinase [Oceanibium sediminis]